MTITPATPWLANPGARSRAAAPAGPPMDADVFERAAGEMLVPDTATRELRQELVAALRSYSPAQVEELRQAGYRIRYRVLPGNIGGIQDGYKKRIDLNPGWGPNERRRATLHELAHALDFLRAERKRSGLERALSRFSRPFESQGDPRLEALYRGYLARAAREPVPLQSAHTPPGSWSGWLAQARRPALATAVATGVAAGVGALPLAAAALLVGGGYTAHKLATTLFAARESARFSPGGGAPGPSAPGTGSPPVWSDYAAASRKSYEYLAEGVAFYLNSAEDRQALQERDPGMCAYVREWLTA